MQVTETSADGLKREFKIVVPAGEMEDKIVSRLGEIGRSIRLPGFRPGKVPLQLLRKRYGTAVRGEVLESTVQGGSAEAIREHNLRPAMPPKIEIVRAEEGADLEYNMSVELLPEMPEPDFAELGLERLVADPPEEDIDKALQRMADQQRKSEPVERPAQTGDVVVIDFTGRIDDKEIPGGSGQDRQVELGSGVLIPGFEDQLVGAAAGEQRTVTVTFPEAYSSPELAGKEAVFDVSVKEVRERQPTAIDDELAKAVGLETLAELRQEVRDSMRRNFAELTRQRIKRELLDKLAERYDFAVPQGMVDLEFDNIWAQYQAEKARVAESASESQGESAPPLEPAAEGEPPVEAAAAADPTAPPTDAEQSAAAEPEDEETARAEYRKLAERRVRLGLLLAEVGRKHNITVTQDELNQALTREARRHPGYERQVLDYYRKNPDAVGNLRAPIFEDKVVDFIIELAKVAERKVTPQELMALPEGNDAETAAA